MADGAKIKFHKLDILIRNIVAVGDGAPKYMNDVVSRCMHDDVWPMWIKQISMSDHTLEDLRKLGHPYSRRFGADSFVHPDDVVHIQDGDLLGGSRIEPTEGGYKLINDSPEYAYLRYGTMNMRMRDPGGGAMAEALPLIKQRFAIEVKNAIVEYMMKG